MSFPRGIARVDFPSLQEELLSNSTKQGRKKILIYRVFLLFFLDCSKALLLAMTIRYPRNNAFPRGLKNTFSVTPWLVHGIQ
ncbi:hypothetical protein [Rickettsia asembonensis]|uniref:hypothetical protein n=1 Tax=Rickettsia asembonensis TaxID=1068590 RepID=UPI0023FA2ECC|nr:hypothetical protein [Rickettsia asembonensis]